MTRYRGKMIVIFIHLMMLCSCGVARSMIDSHGDSSKRCTHEDVLPEVTQTGVVGLTSDFSLCRHLTYSGAACGGSCRRVGVYISGIMRSLDHTICSIQKYVLEPLRSQGHILYLFAKVEKDERAPFVRMLANLGEFEEAHVRFVPQPHVEDTCAQYCANHLHRPTLLAYGNISYCRKRLASDLLAFEVDQLRRKIEMDSGLKLDWVTWLRTDVIFATFIYPRLESLEDTTVYVPNWQMYDPSVPPCFFPV